MKLSSLKKLLVSQTNYSLNRWFSDFTDADRNKKLSKYRDENLISENEIPIHEHAGQIWPISKKLGYI